MNRVRDLAPWEWMEETEIFGVQHPATGEIGFVSIMGNGGEHYAVSAYRGAQGLYGFWHMQELGPFIQPQDLMNTPQLQASFEDRDMLEKHDYQLIKTLGLRYRGRSAWPQFRSFRRGYAPWFIEQDEAEFLEYILEQLLVVAPRVKQQPEILDPHHDHHYLVRVARKDKGTLTWEDKVLPIAPPPPLQLEIDLNPVLMNAVGRLPRAKHKVEADFFMFPGMIGKGDERPYFPYVLLMLDTTHDFMLGFEMLTPVPSLEQMWASIGPTALQQLVKSGSMPAEIRVRDEILYGMLQPFAELLKFKVKRVHRLPMLDRARQEFEDYMGR
jgi:hypothetical protein